jgi:signal transduction histidine kinase
LEDGLRESASELSNKIGIPVDVHLGAAGSTLAEDERAVALRVAQEALRNVGKHASATHAWIATRRETGSELDGDRWVLEVGDDGQGFVPDDAVAHEKRRHFGLRFMRERAELVGAALSIDANPSAGTVVRLSIRERGERS